MPETDLVAGAASPRQSRLAWLRREHDTAFLPLVAIALWALAHPYEGIVGDATLYIGRTLADLDPQGLGRDLFFAHDEQSRFSLYPRLVKAAVTMLGTDRGAMALTLASTALWISALALLARRFVGQPAVWLIVAFVAVLPVNYGAPQRFGFAEMFAVPRPMAEAFVLFAGASFVRGRTMAAFALLSVAAVVHPLMALACVMAIGLALAFEDRRWWILAAVGGVTVAVGALLHLPVLDRLLEPMDADLKALASNRSPLLFPTLWPAAFLAPIIAQMVSIAVAASLSQDRRRLWLLAAMMVGPIGILVQALFGDILSSLLVIQVQVWRMAWLTAAMGSFALALCTLELIKRDGRARITLAFLATAWLASCGSDPLATFCLAAIALILHFGRERFPWSPSPFAVRVVWATAGLVALYANLNYLIGFTQFLAQMPPESTQGFGFFLNQRYIAFWICALLLALMLPRKPSRFLFAGRCAAGVLLAVAAARFWDDRTPFQHLVDANIHPPELTQKIADRPGEVLWVGGLGEAWYLTGRPQWASPQQGVATVFSRDLALAWRERIAFLRDEGLADQNVLSALRTPSAAESAHLSDAGLTHLCQRLDAPAWIIAALEVGTEPPAGWPAARWHLPRPIFKITDEGQTYAWHRFDDFLVLSCPSR